MHEFLCIKKKDLTAKATTDDEKSELVESGVQADENEMGENVLKFCGDRMLVVSAKKADAENVRKLVKVDEKHKG